MSISFFIKNVNVEHLLLESLMSSYKSDRSHSRKTNDCNYSNVPLINTNMQLNKPTITTETM